MPDFEFDKLIEMFNTVKFTVLNPKTNYSEIKELLEKYKTLRKALSTLHIKLNSKGSGILKTINYGLTKINKK